MQIKEDLGSHPAHPKCCFFPLLKGGWNKTENLLIQDCLVSEHSDREQNITLDLVPGAENGLK